MHIFSCTNTFRQPFLALLQSIDSYRILITTNRVAHIAILAVTAAIAEEIGRYIAFRFFVKGQSAQNTPLYFGLGHGGIEAPSVGVNSVILLVCSPLHPYQYGIRCCFGRYRTDFHIVCSNCIFLYCFFVVTRKKTYRYLIIGNLPSFQCNDFLPCTVFLDYSVSPFIFEIGLSLQFYYFYIKRC